MKIPSIGISLLGALFSLIGLALGETAAKRPVVVVDNEDAGFRAEGKWNRSTRDPGFYGKGYLWHAKGKGEAQAIWDATLPKPGRYNAYARWVMSKPTDRAQDAPFTIKMLKGDFTIRVNLAHYQSAAEYPAGHKQSPWNLLGTFPFEKEAKVILTNDADNSVVADAVRFEYMEPLDVHTPQRGRLLFQDDCSSMDNWFIEGSEGHAEIINGTLRLTSTSNRKGIHAWFRPDLPDNVIIEYDMTVHGAKGFALVFFSAHGQEGQDILTGLPPRDGTFNQYVRNPEFLSYHLSVHRMGTKSWVGGANLNKNPGKTLVQRRAVDPCPPSEGDQTYHMKLVKMGPGIKFFVGDQLVLFYIDDSPTAYAGGKFGFRQIYLSQISYDNLRVYEAVMPGQ